MAPRYGPLVRLWGVQGSQLPEPTASGQDLTPLLTSILLEASPFISDVPSAQQSPFTSSWKTKGSRQYPHSKSPVYLYERTVPAEALRGVANEHHPPGVEPASVQPETWFLRRSVHEDAALERTAAWDEFERCFKDAHAEAERQFTPTVLSTRVERDWDCRGVEVELGETWDSWTLKLEESVHKMPPPLKNRVFPVLQATAAVRGTRKFLVVQIATTDSWAEPGGEENVRGAYTSVERVMDTGDGIEWIMGTTSNAKGVLPMWVQRLATPGMVAKDVDMFLSWIATQRAIAGKERRGVHNGQQPMS